PFAALSIVPAQPSSFDPVNLRITVDSCAFNSFTVRTQMRANVVTVTQQLNNCLVAGARGAVDIRLGSCPAGAYRVQLFRVPTPAAPDEPEVLAFAVADRPEIAVFPPAGRPLT